MRRYRLVSQASRTPTISATSQSFDPCTPAAIAGVTLRNCNRGNEAPPTTRGLATLTSPPNRQHTCQTFAPSGAQSAAGRAVSPYAARNTR